MKSPKALQWVDAFTGSEGFGGFLFVLQGCDNQPTFILQVAVWTESSKQRCTFWLLLFHEGRHCC